MGSVQTLSGGFFGWKEGLRRGGNAGGTFHRGISNWGNCHGEENFYEGGAGFFRIFLKNNEKMNMKKFFSTESKEQY